MLHSIVLFVLFYMYNNDTNNKNELLTYTLPHESNFTPLPPKNMCVVVKIYQFGYNIHLSSLHISVQCDVTVL